MSEVRLGPDQLASLAEYQRGMVFHPYTCPRHDDIQVHIRLIPGKDSWFCAHDLCDYTQAYRKEDVTVAEFIYHAIVNGEYPPHS